jgi:hypothetical protein
LQQAGRVRGTALSKFYGSLSLGLTMRLLKLTQDEIIEEMLFFLCQLNSLRLGIEERGAFLLERLSFDYIQLL